MVDVIQVITSLVTIAVGALVSFAVAVRYGPKAVLRENTNRLHSEKLVHDVLAPWRQDPFKYVRVGVAFKGVGDLARFFTKRMAWVAGKEPQG